MPAEEKAVVINVSEIVIIVCYKILIMCCVQNKDSVQF